MRSSLLISALGLSIAPFLIGCATSSEPVVVPGPFTGPALSVDSTGPRHTISMVAPSVGWSLDFDRRQKYFDRTEVFVTITRPNPAFMHPPAEVRQLLDSTVESGESMIVFARVVDYGAKEGTYQRATASLPARAADEVVPSRN